ncbi:hypothetical protein [Streptomyces vietnamensis]|uniref:hypothetical protein n=1 Tax=Streptomyces vietnamensis TaxID=362257 RepID=UPI00343F0801
MKSVPVGQMARLGLPVDKYYGRPMHIAALQDTDRAHSDSRCPAVAGRGDTGKRRVLFDADIASRMCACCCVEADGPRDESLGTAIIDLVSLRDLLDEEDEEEQNRDDPGYVPSFLRANFNPDHWRTIQCNLTEAANSLQSHPWLYHWAAPYLTRAASYAERRCAERRRLIDSVAIERTAAALYERGRSAPKLARMWSSWRHRVVYGLPSPDDELYGENARLRLPNPDSTSILASVTISMRLPPTRFESDGVQVIDTLSHWEQDVIAAYETVAHWASGTVTLTVPPVVARELLCPARNLDLTASVQVASP